MNLAIVRRRLAVTGGAERFIFDIAGTLAERGIGVTLIAEGGEARPAFAGDVVALPRRRGGRAARFRGFQDSVAQALADRRFDLVQSHERLLTADIFRAGDGVHAAWFDRLRRDRPPWRRMAMKADGLHRLYKEAERRMVRETDMVFVANSALVARELRDWLDVPEARLRMIENGVDLARFAPATPEERTAARAKLGIPDERPVIAYVGSGFERKGAFQLVRALAAPGLGDAAAVIAGRDRAERSLKAQVRRLGLSGRVVVTGPVADPRDVLRAADLFALPTLYDPMPNAALEALASGLPVVTTPDAGIAEAIAETGAGAVASRDPEALADAIGAVLDRRPAAREAALDLRGRFALSRAVDQWLDLYREVSR